MRELVMILAVGLIGVVVGREYWPEDKPLVGAVEKQAVHTGGKVPRTFEGQAPRRGVPVQNPGPGCQGGQCNNWPPGSPTY